MYVINTSISLLFFTSLLLLSSPISANFIDSYSVRTSYNDQQFPEPPLPFDGDPSGFSPSHAPNYGDGVLTAPPQLPDVPPPSLNMPSTSPSTAGTTLPTPPSSVYTFAPPQLPFISPPSGDPLHFSSPPPSDDTSLPSSPQLPFVSPPSLPFASPPSLPFAPPSLPFASPQPLYNSLPGSPISPHHPNGIQPSALIAPPPFGIYPSEQNQFGQANNNGAFGQEQGSNFIPPYGAGCSIKPVSINTALALIGVFLIFSV